MTGRRIAEMMQGAEDTFGPCNIKALRVSNLTRAKETAEIIAAYLPGVPVLDPDPMLNEGRPCHTIPGGTVSDKDIALTDAHHPRIEGAFQKYVYRSSLILSEKDPQDDDPSEHHEFEIIICHANVIRYIMCRCVWTVTSTNLMNSHVPTLTRNSKTERCNCHPRHGCVFVPSIAASPI
jgi:serine/threonine-protein phosphatase PGAM5